MFVQSYLTSSANMQRGAHIHTHIIYTGLQKRGEHHLETRRWKLIRNHAISVLIFDSSGCLSSARDFLDTRMKQQQEHREMKSPRTASATANVYDHTNHMNFLVHNFCHTRGWYNNATSAPGQHTPLRVVQANVSTDLLNLKHGA